MRRRFQLHTEIIIEAAIAQHVQLLNAVIAQARSARAKAISKVQFQIHDLQAEFQLCECTSTQVSIREGRTNEIINGGFGLKSKNTVIQMIEKVWMEKYAIRILSMQE